MAELKKFPLTEEEMKQACLLAVRKYCGTSLKTGFFDYNSCLNTARNEFTYQYRKARGLRMSTPLPEEYLQEMEDLYKKQWDVIESEAAALALSMGSKVKAREITKVTASHYIRDALNSAGFSGYITCQCYRACVTVVLPSKYNIKFMIRYRDIMDGKLDEIMKRFIEFTHTVEALPIQVKVWK